MTGRNGAGLAPVIMIGWDAADFDIVRRLVAARKLPVLASLFARGSSGRLESNAAQFAGGVWPTFYTSRDVAWHGLYHNKLWRQESMRCEIAHESWIASPPFWELLDPRIHAAILDVPMTVASPKPLDGVHLAGWGTHDVITRGAWPENLWPTLTKRVGPPTMPAELFGPQTPRTLARLADHLDRTTDQLASAGTELLTQRAWDLFLMVFGAAHRGGHYLWNGASSEGDDALLHVYRGLDRALGRLLAAAPNNARVMVFAVHGMGRNTAWADRCSDMLARILSGDVTDDTSVPRAPTPPKRGLLLRLKQFVPWRLARVVTTRLPARVQARLVQLWSRRMYDWTTTRAFPLPMDHAGYIRLNVRGREPAGIVESGVEYDTLCDELITAFSSFRDLATGLPIIRRIHRARDLAPTDATARHRLPDLVIEWDTVSPLDSPGIVSPRFGELRWPTGELPSGRGGNHRSEGWFVAAGPGIPMGRSIKGHHIMDLVPTAWTWLGAKPNESFHGRPIEGLSS